MERLGRRKENLSCHLDEGRAVRTYKVTGQIFFATAETFHSVFDFREEDFDAIQGVDAGDVPEMSG
jgi:MFS superfamily sulfate permease-like transporter